MVECCGFVTFWYGSRSGSADPYHRLKDPDPDPALFVIDFQDANKNKLSFLAHYLLKAHLHCSSKIKSYKEVTNSRSQGVRQLLQSATPPH